jgi:hypothetical protein
MMASAHKRNVGPMQAAARCGAKTRSGAPCASPRIAGGKRCRMHGRKGSGAPKGNRNALKTGLHTATARMHKKEIRQFSLRCKVLIALVNAEHAMDPAAPLLEAQLEEIL